MAHKADNHNNANINGTSDGSFCKLQILSENALRELSKDLPSMIPKGVSILAEHEVAHLRFLFAQLQTTADAPSLSFSHGAAAMNALSGFLNRAAVSSVPALATLCFAFETWRHLFDLFLRRSETNKPKPVRQLFLSLVGLLTRNLSEETRLAQKDYAMRRTIAMIVDEDETTSVKPAFQVLEHFLIKDVTNSSDVLCALAARRKAQVITISKGVQEDPLCLGLAGPSNPGRVGLEQDFISSVFAWIRYPDLVAAAGRLVAVFVKSLPNLQDGRSTALEDEMPLWMRPLQRVWQSEPQHLESIGTYVLPELLKINRGDTSVFLKTLNLKDLYGGRTGDMVDSDVIICMLVVDIVTKLRPDNRNGSAEELGFFRLDKQAIALGLLEHRSPAIRTRALSIAIKSSSTTAPLPTEVLSSLRSSICFFHTEVDPKVRNEYIAVARNTISRIMRAIWSSRNTASSCRHAMNEGIEKENTKLDIQEMENAERLLMESETINEQHLSFLKFYMLFLAKELQPTASYQRHITALSILSTTLQCTFTKNTMVSLESILLQQDIEWPGLSHYTRSILRPLLDLLMDPFDDVRSMASLVLSILLETLWKPQFDASEGDGGHQSLPVAIRGDQAENILYLPDLLNRAQTTMRATGRADHADGVARLYCLVWQFCKIDHGWHVTKAIMIETLFSGLEKDIDIARSCLRSAVANRPLHGHLIALRSSQLLETPYRSPHADLLRRYIISQPRFYSNISTPSPAGTWADLKKRAMSSCAGVWTAVKTILCHDSPEGHCVGDQGDDDLEIGMKDTLSFAWRALKESSLLLSALLQASLGTRKDEQGLSYNDFQKIGWLSFTQLAELRHRGAFSTVSRTFALCCANCIESEDPQTNLLPERWYKSTLSYIQQNAATLTRRSAGLPAMITGILTAHIGDTFFDNVVLDLQAIADMPMEETPNVEELHLPQVHALNSLKDLFSNTSFGPSTEPHIAYSLEIAASCLDSKLWAMRNSGLMLFNSLIRRMNGGSDINSSRTPSSHRRLSAAAYERFPNLPNLILRLLQVYDTPGPKGSQAAYGETFPSSTKTAQRVFPALEVVARSGLPGGQQTDVLNLIHYHMRSPVWSIREKAANTLALVVGEGDAASQVDRLMQPDWHSQNALHGRLLCIRQLVKRYSLSGALGTNGDPESDLRLLVMFRSDVDNDKFSLAKFNMHRESLLVTNRCPITIAAYLDILGDIIEALVQRKSRFARYFGLILQKYIFNEWLGRDIDQPLGQPAPKPALTLESLQQFISNGGKTTDGNDLSAESSFEPSLSLQSVALERCAELIKRACGGGVSSDYIDDIASKKFLEGFQEIPWADPHHADEALRSHGGLIGIAYANNVQTVVLQRNLTAWIRMLALAGDAHNELSTRLAAVQSIEGFFTSLRKFASKDTSSQELLGLYLALWDILADDDEDVRDLGASVVSQLISKSPSAGKAETERHLSLSPAAARPRMMQFIIYHYARSSTLWKEAVLRLVATSTSQQMLLYDTAAANSCPIRTFSEMFQQARTLDTALFVEEKQNLYIDEVEEARYWANALSYSASLEAAKLLTPTLSIWTIEGLAVLARAIAGGEDGPFGWTSIPEMFALGIRVILAAKVLMSRGIEVGRCKSLLEDILQEASKRQLHDLWVAEILEALRKPES